MTELDNRHEEVRQEWLAKIQARIARRSLDETVENPTEKALAL